MGDIQTLDVLPKQLPRLALALALEWAQAHRAELLNDWEWCQQMLHPRPIQPLE
ncbi:DUF4160 domain-containing protein [Paludibacterium yongneupense]|uniref:DUF4160 domain-containing protein n=1 Tax=Paludibacterium yongneupense TaxID=400061 RepID=UPI000421DE72|nr:DUF4160 domain-containing protein [Paludibacterium yongneupense]